MARTPNPEIQEKDLQGFKHFKLLTRLLERLHDHGCQRDRAGNRVLHYDQYAALILLYFFNPIVTSLRAIQQVSQLQKVQRLLGCSRAALGSLSEAARVFDADLLLGIIGDLASQLKPIGRGAAFAEIRGVLTLVDGTLLPALPKLVEALWRDDQHRAFKLHTHFELLKGVPVRMDLTAANASERAMLEAALEPGRVYVTDRGYAGFKTFRRILEAGSSFVCRIRDNSVFEVLESRPLSPEGVAAHLAGDRLIRLKGVRAQEVGLERPLRLIEVRCEPHRTPRGPEQGESLWILTDLLDVPAEVVALIYKHRWAIETFFRFFKHVLGCRHLLSHSTNGIRIQTYLAIIACLLIALWTERKPTLRTYEMICYYFAGLASEEELLAHIDKLAPQI
jgi:hypothetical protein